MNLSIMGISYVNNFWPQVIDSVLLKCKDPNDLPDTKDDGINYSFFAATVFWFQYNPGTSIDRNTYPEAHHLHTIE